MTKELEPYRGSPTVTNIDQRKVGPFALDGDRLWHILKDDLLVGTITDYNWEVTGVSIPFREMITYGDNWYYWEAELQRRGYQVVRISNTHTSPNDSGPKRNIG